MKKFMYWMVDRILYVVILFIGSVVGCIMGVGVVETHQGFDQLSGEWLAESIGMTALIWFGAIPVFIVGYWIYQGIKQLIKKNPIDITIQELYNSLSEKNRDLADQILIKLEEEDARLV